MSSAPESHRIDVHAHYIAPELDARGAWVLVHPTAVGPTDKLSYQTPDFIAEKTGCRVVTFYPSVGGIPELRTYFDVFDRNVDAFVKAMSGKGAK